MTRKVLVPLCVSLLVFAAVNAASAQEAVTAPAPETTAVVAPCSDCVVAAPRCCVPCYRPVVVAPCCPPCGDPCCDPCCAPVVYRRGLFGAYRPVVLYPRYYRAWHRGFYF